MNDKTLPTPEFYAPGDFYLIDGAELCVCSPSDSDEDRRSMDCDVYLGRGTLVFDPRAKVNRGRTTVPVRGYVLPEHDLLVFGCHVVPALATLRKLATALGYQMRGAPKTIPVETFIEGYLGGTSRRGRLLVAKDDDGVSVYEDVYLECRSRLIRVQAYFYLPAVPLFRKLVDAMGYEIT